MMNEFNKIELERSHEIALIEDQLRPGGFLFEIASARVNELSPDASPIEVSRIVTPELKNGKPIEIRFELVDRANADPAVKQVLTENSSQIMDFANKFKLRKIVDGVRQPEDIELIDPDNAIFCIEGGANKTSVVRRGVAIKAMQEVYGMDLYDKALFQFGSDRKPTAESEISTVRELAGDYLKPGEFDEFDANLATAMADGYVANHSDESGNIVMINADISKPILHMIKITQVGGFKEGLEKLLKYTPEGLKQIIVSTNGQYREKIKVSVEAFGRDQGLDLGQTVALGDEPNDEFGFAGNIVRVPARPESAYTGEIALLYRLLNDLN